MLYPGDIPGTHQPTWVLDLTNPCLMPSSDIKIRFRPPDGSHNGSQRVPKGFPKGSQRVPKGFPKVFSKGFPKWFPKGFQNGSTMVYNRVPKGFPIGFPQGFQKGFPKGFPKSCFTGVPQGCPRDSNGFQMVSQQLAELLPRVPKGCPNGFKWLHKVLPESFIVCRSFHCISL